ncbi:MAG: hypothetical protein WC656_04635 [Sulfurimonas sp.]|jgi:hypothetical protein
MKKIIVSLTAASLIVVSATAADKGIDIVTTGQTALYYQTATTNATGAKDLFDQNVASANVGVQLNLDADLKNDFTFGSQITYLGTNGLEKNLVSNTMSNTNGVTAAVNQTNLDSVVALTQINVSKKIANTTVKLGRQELPMALSPLAFSEDWNIFKNTFEAALIVNSDIPQTTLVGAYVSKSNNFADLSDFGNVAAATDAGAATVAGTAYMVTAQNKSIPMTTVTASYYNMAKIGQNLLVTQDIAADALWADVAIADKSLPMGLTLGLQAGQINPDSSIFADTTALGIKASIVPMSALTLTAAYTSVSGDENKANAAIRNVANTGASSKTPLYTQMVANQAAIALDANTIMLKAAYSLGDYGTVIAQGTQTDAGKANLNARSNGEGNDLTDLELLYVVKAAGVNYLAGYVHQMYDTATVGSTTQADATDIIRVWARYNF